VAIQPLKELPETPLKIKRALLSVSDKSQLIPLAKALHEAGVELISTGGTARSISEAGLDVTPVNELTQFPECLDGRVKTLHPKVHAGLLARTSHQPDVDELDKLDVEPIELVVVNLYPFRETIAKPDCTLAEATENIDIGGPTMIRAAAKNFAHVCVLTHPSQYETFIDELKQEGSVSYDLRQKFAKNAFNHTAEYDSYIANYFNDLTKQDNPDQFNVSIPKSQELRYGENPHQKAAVYGNQNEYIDCFHGKQLSYNNYMDIDAALNLMADFEVDEPVCSIFKHTIPCGVATAPTLVKAYKEAFSTDTISPFGGIIIVNREMDLDTAKEIDKIFTEIIMAPSYHDDALELLKQKKNRRLISLKKSVRTTLGRSYRSIFGGALNQEADLATIDDKEFKVVSKRQPTEKERRDLLFAWKVVKHVKSNAIVYAGNGKTVGIGSGQTSRVDSSEIAIQKAKKEGLSLENTVIASDAFFPFADGVEAAAKAGATAVIQPGGSIRDKEVIEMADQYDMAMIFTGKRHFRH